MPASKNKKAESGGVHSHLRARLTYMHKASTYLFSQQHALNVMGENNQTPKGAFGTETPYLSKEKEQHFREQHIRPIQQACLPRHYIGQMRGVSLKSQQRLSIETKRSFCKRCDLPLVPGVTCTEEIQNASKGGKKPWADVLVVRCSACEAEKRFPQNKARSKKLKTCQQEQKMPKDQAEVS